MRARSLRRFHAPVSLILVCGLLLGSLPGCQNCPRAADDELAVRGAIERYRAEHASVLAVRAGRDLDAWPAEHAPYALGRRQLPAGGPRGAADGFENTILTLGMFSDPQQPTTTPAATGPAAGEPTSQAAEQQRAGFVPPEGYWRKDIWHQMGREALELGRRDFWRGFESSFWDLENALVLTATMGASIAIRGTGVDDTIRNRTHGSRALGDMDETLQILGHPGTHFAAAGVLWLGSTLTKDVKQHEVAQSLTQALAVNGATTLLLKASTNTRAPNGDRFAWPSGHTSSAFAAAAVLNEYYGPWVGIPSLALAGLVGYQRIDSRVHDFSDVVFGAMLGYVIGTSIARDEKAQFPELFGMQVIPYADPESGAAGLALFKQW